MMDKPIIFSAPMVRAIIENRKTQTRRILKRQPKTDSSGMIQFHDAGWFAPHLATTAMECAGVKLPYAPGMMLWVRENLDVHGGGVSYAASPGEYVFELPDGTDEQIEFWNRRADVEPDARSRTCPSIFMPRWASRLTLEVEAVKVERLQEISEEDCIAEGPPGFDTNPSFVDGGIMVGDPAQPNVSMTPRCWFRELWDSINRDRAPWDANPWIVAVAFKAHRLNIDSMRGAA